MRFFGARKKPLEGRFSRWRHLLVGKVSKRFWLLNLALQKKGSRYDLVDLEL